MKRLYVCLIALTVAACTTTKGISITEERLAEMKKSKVTVQEVVSQFGQPTGTQLMPTGERVLTYTQSKVHMDPKAAIPIVGLFANDSGYSSSFVALTFGTDSKLLSYSTQSHQFGGGGTTFTPSSN